MQSKKVNALKCSSVKKKKKSPEWSHKGHWMDSSLATPPQMTTSPQQASAKHFFFLQPLLQSQEQNTLKNNNNRIIFTHLTSSFAV